MTSKLSVLISNFSTDRTWLLGFEREGGSMTKCTDFECKGFILNFPSGLVGSSTSGVTAIGLIVLMRQELWGRSGSLENRAFESFFTPLSRNSSLMSFYMFACSRHLDSTSLKRSFEALALSEIFWATLYCSSLRFSRAALLYSICL